MTEFLTNFILPIVKALFAPFDIALGWITLLGPYGALIAVGAVTGLAVNLFQKYCSNQKLLGRRRADLEKLKSLMSDAKASKDEEKTARISSLTSQISSKYALESLKPALYSIPPLCILAMWVGARLSFEPVRPGDVVEVIGTFEDGAKGFTYFVPNEGLASEGPAIVPVAIRKSTLIADAAPPAPAPASAAAVPKESANAMQKPGDSNVLLKPVVEDSSAPQAHWKIRAEKEGEFALQIRHGEDRYSIAVPVHAKGGRPPEPATIFRTESLTRDRLLSVEFKLREPVPSAWWNIYMQAMGIYLITAMIFGLALRRVMGIQ